MVECNTVNAKLLNSQLNKENFNVFVEISKIQNHIIESTKKLIKKTVIDDVSSEFTKNSSIKTKCLRLIVKKILPKI